MGILNRDMVTSGVGTVFHTMVASDCARSGYENLQSCISCSAGDHSISSHGGTCMTGTHITLAEAEKAQLCVMDLINADVRQEAIENREPRRLSAIDAHNLAIADARWSEPPRFIGYVLNRGTGQVWQHDNDQPDRKHKPPRRWVDPQVIRSPEETAKLIGGRTEAQLRKDATVRWQERHWGAMQRVTSG